LSPPFCGRASPLSSVNLVSNTANQISGRAAWATAAARLLRLDRYGEVVVRVVRVALVGRTAAVLDCARLHHMNRNRDCELIYVPRPAKGGDVTGDGAAQ
jgi:hypothetical protein